MSQNNPNKSLAIILTGIIFTMVAFSFASVPLYRMFCQKTGFGGTPKITGSFAKEVKDRVFTVRFTADVNGDLPWRFEPLQKEIKVRAGENAFALYHVTNLSDEPIVGMATYNVTPDKAGGYFMKVECFCFLEQRLEPGQSVDMPLLFFVDPEVTEDANMDDVNTITLSYTFFKFKGASNPKNQGVQTHRMVL